MTEGHRDPSRRSKVRIDALLVERGLAPSRARAQSLLKASEVLVSGVVVTKPSLLVADDADLLVQSEPKYVSRGGLKLEGALEDLSFSPAGLVVADIGASTGGFTDCVLQRGAAKVYAIDVGHGQLAAKLLTDPRVKSLEGTNARALERDAVDGGVDLVVVDASFISLEKLLPALSTITREGGHLLALIKPQFEAGREEASRGGGVIRDPVVRKAAISRVVRSVRDEGYEVLGEACCRVPGPKGNVEHFVLARKSQS